MTHEELRIYAETQERENDLLAKQLYESKQEKMLLITNIKRALEVIGISADGSKTSKAKVLKAISGLITQSMIDESVIERKFSFMKELMPLIEKYKDI